MPAGGYTTAARCAWQAYNVHSGEAICLGGTQLRGFIRAGGGHSGGALCGADVQRAQESEAAGLCVLQGI